MLWPIYLMAGFKDGLGPCVLLAAAVFLLFVEFFPNNSWRSRLVALTYVAVYYVASLAVNIGFWANLFAYKPMFIALKITALIIGVVALLAGVVLFYEWMRLKCNSEIATGVYQKVFGQDSAKRVPGYGAFVLAVFLGLTLAVVSSIWPLDYYITLLSNNILLPGKFWETTAMMAAYGVFQLWLVVSLGLLYVQGSLKRDMRLIISSAIFLSAGVVMYYLL